MVSCTKASQLMPVEGVSWRKEKVANGQVSFVLHGKLTSPGSLLRVQVRKWSELRRSDRKLTFSPRKLAFHRLADT